MSESDNESVSRKEVFDHLRNIQKAEEIAAKRTGINIWVLWGALWIVAWKLMDNVTFIATPIFFQFTLGLILISQAFQLIIQPIYTNSVGDEPRFVNFKALSLSDTPSALIISFFWSIIPALTYWLTFGASFISVSFGGLILLVFCFILWAEYINRNKFPKPIFRSNSKSSNVALHFILAAACITEALNVFKILPSLEIGSTQISLLFIAAFWLISLLLEAQQKHHSDAWTYRTERELLLGFIATNEALRRIEQRYLGERLSDVMEKYWEDISNQLENANKLLNTFKADASEIQNIPVEYTEERKSRIKASAAPVDKAVNKLLNDISEFSKYITELLDSQKVSPKKNIVEAIKSAMQRNEQARKQLEDILKIYKTEKEKLK